MKKKRYMESRKRGVINTSDKCSIECNTDFFFCLYLIVYLFFFLKGQRLRKKYFLYDTLAILNFETLPFLFY